MPKLRIDLKKYHVFIYRPTSSFVVIEREKDSIFNKLLIVYDGRFDRVSDKHTVEVQVLEYSEKEDSYAIKKQTSRVIKVNDMRDLSRRTRMFLKLQSLFGANVLNLV
jgi:hypothetical protein